MNPRGTSKASMSTRARMSNALRKPARQQPVATSPARRPGWKLRRSGRPTSNPIVRNRRNCSTPSAKAWYLSKRKRGNRSRAGASQLRPFTYVGSSPIRQVLTQRVIVVVLRSPRCRQRRGEIPKQQQRTAAPDRKENGSWKQTVYSVLRHQLKTRVGVCVSSETFQEIPDCSYHSNSYCRPTTPEDQAGGGLSQSRCRYRSQDGQRSRDPARP